MIITLRELKILLDTTQGSLSIANWNGWDARTRESVLLAITSRLAEIKLGVLEEPNAPRND